MEPLMDSDLTAQALPNQEIESDSHGVAEASER